MILARVAPAKSISNAMAVSPDQVIIDVVVGLVYNCAGELLIAKRPQDKHYGGHWEFPGGKVESGETEFAALQRELNEECGIDILQADKLYEITHRYPNKQVRLLVWHVERFEGEPYGREGQTVLWRFPHALSNFSFPPANKEILNSLR